MKPIEVPAPTRASDHQPVQVELGATLARSRMQALCEENFDREIACTEREWLKKLPLAMGANPYSVVAQALSVRIGAGQLALAWRNGAPRAEPSNRPSAILVSFRFSGVQEVQRYGFMKRFDLCMQA